MLFCTVQYVIVLGIHSLLTAVLEIVRIYHRQNRTRNRPVQLMHVKDMSLFRIVYYIVGKLVWERMALPQDLIF